jgi:hypothetical protein
MENKIEIISAICRRHPTYGTEKGWSEYVGGMADTGQWYFRKMLDCTEEELQLFLDSIIAEENKPIEPLTEQEKRDRANYFAIKDIWMSEGEKKKLEAMNNKFVLNGLYGK